MGGRRGREGDMTTGAEVGVICFLALKVEEGAPRQGMWIGFRTRKKAGKQILP